MDLQEFISATLTEIYNGVTQARENCPEMAIAPNRRSGGVSLGKNADAYPNVDVVEYEVILTDKELSDKSKGIGVSFGSFGAGYENRKGGENTSSTKLKFSIPIVFPD